MHDAATSSTSSRLHVVRADRARVAAAVDCHLAAFPPDEFPHDTILQLGRSFQLVHHRFYVEDPEGLLLVAIDEASGRVAGFTLGGPTAVRRRFLWRHGLRFGLGVAWKALTRPAVRHRVIAGIRGTLRRFGLLPGGSQDAPPPRPHEPWTFLYFLGTHPDFQGRGVGRLLVRAFELESLRMGCRVMRLTTGLENQAAIALYEKCGWKIIGKADGLVYFEQRDAAPPEHAPAAGPAA